MWFLSARELRNNPIACTPGRDSVQPVQPSWFKMKVSRPTEKQTSTVYPRLCTDTAVRIWWSRIRPRSNANEEYQQACNQSLASNSKSNSNSVDLPGMNPSNEDWEVGKPGKVMAPSKFETRKSRQLSQKKKRWNPQTGVIRGSESPFFSVFCLCEPKINIWWVVGDSV